MNFNELQKVLFEEYKKNGYLNSWNYLEYYNDDIQTKFDIAELGLVTSEVVEAIEVLRDNINDRVKLGFELSDIIIRVMNFASRKDIDLEYYILWKNKINLERGKLHGRKV